MRIGWWGRDYSDGGNVISGVGMETILRGNITFAGHQFSSLLEDEAYRAIPRARFEEMLVRFRWDDPKYHREKFDCDDLTMCFLADIKRAWATHSKCEEALAFGTAWLKFPIQAQTHRLIWQYDAEGRINLYEPETNKRREPGLIEAVYEVRA